MDYEKLLSATRDIINEWDPLDLIKDGAPKDEYDHETAKILAGIKDCNNTNDIEQLILNIFRDNFEPDMSLSNINKYSQVLWETWINFNK